MDRADSTTKTRKPRSRGQIAVVFAATMIVVVGLCAIVVDVSWFWANSLRMQRAADAAALAGVVMLPGDEASAIARAEAEATKNGYTDGVGGVVVTAWQDTTNPRRLRVDLTANVGTFFARVLGINSFPAGVQAKADYTLPVPMGSPENYYGVFGLVRHPGGGVTTVTTDTFNDVTTSWLSAAINKGSGWTTNTNVYTTNNVYSTSATANAYQAWGNFGITLNGTVTNIDGIEVSAEVSRSGSGNQTNCQIQFELSYNNGTNYTTGAGTGVKLSTAIPTADAYQAFGGVSDTWNRSWSTGDLTNTNFRVRARTIKPSTAVCAAAILHRIDHLRIRVTYDYTTTTSVFTPDSNLTSPTGGALNPRGFWGTMLTQGAESINGDAYSPYYNTRTGSTNPNYSATDYYQYAVEMPAGATGGEVWVYDPGFCAVASDMGTGDRYFGNTNTNGSNEFGAFYNLYNTQNTLYDATDDGAAVASSGNTFQSLAASDQTMNGPSGANLDDCSATFVGSDTSNPQYYHNRWYQLASGLTGSGAAGTIYRLHVSSTDPSNSSAQLNMNGQNSFALYSTATGGTPRIYGLGAMEAYSPLPASATSTFYLAQIGAEHAGKTVAIELWDPGDTNGLTANLAILIPGTSSYSSATLNWTSAQGTTNTNASSCNSSTGTNVTSITAANGSTSNFNGCWVTILVSIPTTYTAPTPPGESQPGWWKIQYTMGSGSSTAFDLTTWQVEIRGNPVHLVLP